MVTNYKSWTGQVELEVFNDGRCRLGQESIGITGMICIQV